jgi:phosphate transport system protein
MRGKTSLHMPATRTRFLADMAELERRALSGLDLVCEALDRVIEASVHHDRRLAEMVIAEDDRIDELYLDVHHGLMGLLARQSPVATDLRLIAALLDVIHHVERMGDQCVNIAKILPAGSGQQPQVDEVVLKRLAEMGAQARHEVAQAKLAFEQRKVDLAHDLVRQDERINTLNREVFRLAVEIGEDADCREWAMQLMLAARAIERIGDNAVDIGEQVAFVVTGLYREFRDASQPANAA